MSNEPGTYHLLVTLPETYGEEADEIADLLEKFLRTNTIQLDTAKDTVVHLTPETLPDRYMVNDRTQVHLTNEEADVVWAHLGGEPEGSDPEALRTLMDKLEAR